MGVEGTVARELRLVESQLPSATTEKAERGDLERTATSPRERWKPGTAEAAGDAFVSTLSPVRAQVVSHAVPQAE